MSYEAFTSLPVILAALAAWLIGIVGAKIWDWLGDWRQARMLGISVLEFRWARGRRAHNIVSRTLAMHRVQERKSAAGDTWTVSNVAGVQDAPERVQPAARGAAVGNGCPGPEPEVVFPVETAPAVVAEKTNKNAEFVSETIKSPENFGSSRPRVFIASKDQIREFLAFEAAHHRQTDGSVRILREAPEWSIAYRRWAVIHAIAQMPEATFLNLLGKAAGITKSRPRIKDPVTGRVMKNDAGTPLRASVYAMIDDVAESKPKRETKADKAARAAAELAERRQMASRVPDQSWAEAIASMSQDERLNLGLDGLYERVAA